jgi:prepilin-type N-terminal cleavage/methylation domain-containing protein
MKEQININSKGFTLIELSIVLVILSMLLGVMVTVVPVQENKDSAAQTKENLKFIEDAILAYFNQRGFLPCPAALNTSINSAGFGTSTVCGTVGSALPAYAESGSGADRIRIGGVPTRELKIPDSYAFDGWNNRITYAAAAELSQSIAAFQAHTSAGTGMTIRDSSTNSMHTGSPTFIAYTIVSHGINARGATNYQGTQIPLACGAFNDSENCNNDAIFRDQFTDPATFDDQILWKTKAQLSAESLFAGINAPVKYGLWENRATGAVFLPRAGFAFQSWTVRSTGTQIYNTTSVTNGATNLTFPPGRYYIREGHMACGLGAATFQRFDQSYNRAVVYSTVDFLDDDAVNKPCIWQTASGFFTTTASQTTETYTWTTFPESPPTLGMGRSVSTPGLDPSVLDRVEVWEY